MAATPIYFVHHYCHVTSQVFQHKTRRSCHLTLMKCLYHEAILQWIAKYTKINGKESGIDPGILLNEILDWGFDDTSYNSTIHIDINSI